MMAGNRGLEIGVVALRYFSAKCVETASAPRSDRFFSAVGLNGKIIDLRKSPNSLKSED